MKAAFSPLLLALNVLTAGVLACSGTANAATAYRVKAGDTLIGIAARAGVSVAQLRAANPALRRSSTVQLGRVIQLPGRQIPAQMHTVKSGQNLTTISGKYGLSLRALLAANPKYAGSKVLLAGARLYIPPRTAAPRLNTSTHPARAPQPTRATTTTIRTAGVRVSAGGSWLWPLPGYTSVSSGFGGRTLEGAHETHYGIDITAPIGTPVRAARAGRVLESRPDFARGWGWTVVLEHPDGWITRYAHLSANLVRAGEPVVRGQRIGRVGNTGRSTGPHLHYGTYLRWNPHDPLSLY